MNASEFVNVEERAKTAIKLGESHFREFKSALHGPPGEKNKRDRKDIARDIGEALVAFANADGGELLIGVEDEAIVTGVDQLSETDIDILLDAPKRNVHEKTPLPQVRTAILSIDGRKVLYFSIRKSTTYIHLTSDGRCVQRSDLETVPIPAEQILFDRQERLSREYDRAYVDGADVSDLDGELVESVANQISPGMSNEKCLQYLDLAEYVGPGLRPRKAALLLFAREPTRWHPRLQIRIIKVQGNELLAGEEYNVISDQTVTGNILQLIENGWEALRPQLVQTRLGEEARFQSTAIYPELACREALVNAIAHRDYSEEGRGIEIYVFDDRMEVKNPGLLLSSIKLEDLVGLQGVHQSRNASVARVLRDLGYMRELGEGMRRMFELMRKSELIAPELVSAANSFSVILRHSTIYSEPQSLWLSQFKSFNLNREQKAIVVLGMDKNIISPQNIWDSLGIVDTEHYRQLIRSLQDLRILSAAIRKSEAQKLARKRRLPVRDIPRFMISVNPTGKVKTTYSSGEDSIEDGPDPSAKLWIASLPPEFSNEALVEFLNGFAEVQDLYIPRDQAGRAKGYAFAEFDSHATAKALLIRLDGLSFTGRNLTVRWAHGRKKNSSRH